MINPAAFSVIFVIYSTNANKFYPAKTKYAFQDDERL